MSTEPNAPRLEPPPPLAKRLAWLVGLLLAGLLGAGLLSRLGGALEEQSALEVERAEAAEAAGDATSVRVVVPAEAEAGASVALTGTLEPAQAADLAFGVPGRVARVEVALGQRVSRGDVLVALDRASVRAQSAQSSAVIQVAAAQAAMARDRVQTLEPLARSGSVAERELTTAQQQLAVAEAQLAQARAGRRQISASQADHLLRAPFDGVVTRVPSGVGVAANPGVPLARIEDLSALRLRTTVHRSELERLVPGMTVRLEGSDAVGTVTAAVRSLDPQTRRAPVEVRVPNEGGMLVANAFVTGRVETGERVRALRIPAPCRRPDGTVLVVAGDGRVQVRPVTARVGGDGAWLVTEGLGPNERVVLRPALVREGTVVTPIEAGATSSSQTAALEP